MVKDFLTVIQSLPDNVVAVRTIDGIVEWNIENLIDQPTEGLLYDLNRDMLTNYARLADNDERAINDIAIAKVVRYLMRKVQGIEKE